MANTVNHKKSNNRDGRRSNGGGARRPGLPNKNKHSNGNRRSNHPARTRRPKDAGSQPLFDRIVDEEIQKAHAIERERGSEYGDSWGIGYVDVFTKAFERWNPTVESRHGYTAERALRLCALIDTKLSRVNSSDTYNRDSVVDLVNYLLVLAGVLGD